MLCSKKNCWNNKQIEAHQGKKERSDWERMRLVFSHAHEHSTQSRLVLAPPAPQAEQRVPQVAPTLPD
jgi:predicted NAD/FAD-dependent oxidoreductase